jgi:hypothetical protein
MADVAERLSAATGTSIRYVDVPPAEARDDGIQRRRARPAVRGAPRRKGAHGVTVIEEVFGIRPTSFAELATRHAAIFRGAAGVIGSCVR